MSTEKGEGSNISSQSEAAQAKQKSDPPTEPGTPSPTASTSGPSQQQQHSSSSSSPPPITTPSRLFDEQQQQLATVSSLPSSQPKTPPAASTPTAYTPPEDERKQQASTKRDQASASTSPSTLETATYAGGGAGIAGGGGGGTAASADASLQRPRQVIAVSASKGPAAFFNLARKFLVTDEMCDLSALEGAIVSAVDAAHLLERSKLATIVRVQTSYVAVEPKRRKQAPPSPHPTQPQQPGGAPAGTSLALPPPSPAGAPAVSGVAGTPQPHMGGVADAGQQQRPRRGSSGRELRRARIVITVRRTENYKRWLEENPLQAIIAGDGAADDYDKATAHSTDD